MVEVCPCQTDWRTGEYHINKCPEAIALRDSWTTPLWLTELLPPVDIDPASNSRSTVRAKRDYRLERGEDGLAVPWTGSMFLNGPYSDMLPWAHKANDEWYGKRLTSATFLVKLDPTTKWWKSLASRANSTREVDLWLFDKRLQHSPPPRIKASTNNFASAIIHWRRDSQALPLGQVATLWV